MDRLRHLNFRDLKSFAEYAPAPIQPLARRGVDWVGLALGPNAWYEEGEPERPDTPPSLESFLRPEVERIAVPILMSPKLKRAVRLEETDVISVNYAAAQQGLEEKSLEGSSYYKVGLPPPSPPVRIYLSDEEQKHVKSEIEDAISVEYFKPLPQRYVQEHTPGKVRRYGKGYKQRKDNAKAMERSMEIAYKSDATVDQQKRRDQIMREWQAREERGNTRPAVGFESLSEMRRHEEAKRTCGIERHKQIEQIEQIRETDCEEETKRPESVQLQNDRVIFKKIELGIESEYNKKIKDVSMFGPSVIQLQRKTSIDLTANYKEMKSETSGRGARIRRIREKGQLEGSHGERELA